MPNDTTLAPRVTHVEEISGLQELWEETLGDSRLCIAILDGPVDKSHPSLAGASLTEVETLVPGVANQGPASRHGTHVASIIFGQHGSPVKGIAPGCRGLIVPVFKDGADGAIVSCSQLDLARAIIQAVHEGAQIINVSGGEFSPSGTAHPFLVNAVKQCEGRGVLIVAAAGNEGCDCLHIPGALPSVLAVGAMNAEGEPMESSNWGEAYQTQGILGPGENILGATPGDRTVTNSGTSYATPIVTGIIALLLSIQLKRGQKPSPHAVREAILSSAVGCDDEPVPDCRRLLAGRLNIRGAMYRILQGGEIMSNQTKTQSLKRYTTTKYSQPSAPRVAMSQKSRKPMVYGSANPNQITPSECHCGTCEHGECTCESEGAHLVYALGTINYDFGTEARKDSIMEVMRSLEELGSGADPYDPVHLLAYLKKYPFEAASVIWTLELDGVPIYALEGRGAFGSDVYQLLRQFLCEQIGGRKYEDTDDCVEIPRGQRIPGETRTGGKVERVAIPGYIVGSVMLSTGQAVPVISPERRGMFSWNTDALVDEVLKHVSIELPKKSRLTDEQKRMLKERITELLQRVYEEFRNLGTEPQDRAMNYIFTNIFSTADSVIKAFKVFMEDLALDTVEVAESPVNRPNSEYWEVKLVFFSKSYTTQFRKVYVITVDVGDVVPVTIGEVRSWIIR